MRLFSQYKGLKRENYILFFGRIVTNLGAMVRPMMTMILNKKLGMTASQTALFLISTGIIFLPANLWGGQLADKFNKKRLIIVCDAVSVILYIVSGFIPLSRFSLYVLLAGSLFQTLEGPAYKALVADLTPADKREKAFSLLYLGGNIGYILSPTLGGLLFNNYLWLCFLISGLSIAVSTVLIALFVKDTGTSGEKENSAAENQKKQTGGIAGIIRRSATLIIFIIAFSFYDGGYTQFGYLMPLDISNAFPENGSVIYGTVTSVNCIIVVLFTPVITMLMEKISLTRKFSIGTFVQMLSFVSFLVSFGFIPGYYISIALFTIGEILVTTSVGAFLSQRVPASYRGRIYGVTSFTSAFMSGIVEWNSGWIFDSLGSAYAWGFSIAMSTIASIAAFILIFVDRKEFPETIRQKEA